MRPQEMGGEIAQWTLPSTPQISPEKKGKKGGEKMLGRVVERFWPAKETPEKGVLQDGGIMRRSGYVQVRYGV